MTYLYSKLPVLVLSLVQPTLKLTQETVLMRILSGVIRIITGLAIMAMALSVYLANEAQLQGSDPVTVVIVGQEFTASPPQLIIGLIVAAAIGGMIELMGVFTLVRRPKPASEQTPPSTQG